MRAAVAAQESTNYIPNRIQLLLKIIITALIILLLSPDNVFAIPQQNDWSTLKSPHFIIHAPERADLEEIGQAAENIYGDMAKRYHYNQDQKIDLYIYTERSLFISESPSEDAAGYASPSSNMIAILLGAGNSTITLGHEINHIIFMRSVPRIDTVPEWFIEGLALHESQPGVEAAELEKYALVRDIPDLIGNANTTGNEAITRKDYAQGFLMINFIIDKFGENKLYDAIGKMQSGLSFDDALVQSLGRNQSELNRMWKSYARNQALVIWLAQLKDIGWYILSALVLVVLIAMPLRKRKRLREMEDDLSADEETQSEQIMGEP